MNSYLKSILITVLIVICTAITIELLPNFSSPSSVATASNQSAVVIISCLDLQRALNRLYPEAKLVEDGICGEMTMYWWNWHVFNRYANDLKVRIVE